MNEYFALGIAVLFAFSMIFFPGMVFEASAKNYKHLNKIDKDMQKVFELGIRFGGIFIFVLCLIIYFTLL